MPENKFVPADQLLPAEILNSLSEGAVRLYSKIWHLMAKKQKTEVWVSDNAASVTARVDFDQLASAKSELVRSGLITIRQGRWPAEDPPNICHQYKFAATT